MALKCFKYLLLTCFLAFTLQISLSSSASPHSNSIPEISDMEELVKLGEGCMKQPEDVAMDENGVLYAATRDGWIKKFLLENETLINWKHMDSHTFLGITTTRDGDVIVCDTQNGLLKVSEEGFEVLDGEVRYASDVVEASDGSLYFTVSSTKYKPENYYKDLVEGKPYGQLLKYDPESGETTVLHEGFFFANGIALSKDEDFLVICESWKFQCRRYWLRGKHEKKVDDFIKKLPGGPNNINLAADGSFWVTIIKMNQTGVRAIQRSGEKWKIIGAYPGLIDLIIPIGKEAGARVVRVDSDGKVIGEVKDPNATYISFVSSAIEYEDNLYMASLNSNFIGKLPLHLDDNPKPKRSTV